MSTIIFIEDSSKSLFGGGQKISSIALDQFKKSGKRVIYIDFVENSRLMAKLDTKRSKVLKLYHKVFYGPFGTLLQFIVLIPNFLILAVTMLKEKNPVVYATSKMGLVYGGTLALLLRVPYIYHAHMLLQGKVYDGVILFLMRNAKCCICVSDYVYLEFQKRGLKNGIVLENPMDHVDLKNFKPKDLEVFRVLFIGSVIEIKGLKYLLDIFNIYSGSDIEIHVLGSGSLLNNYKQAYRSYSQIIFHGFVNDVHSYLNKMANVLVLPTVISEAAPTAIQQAMLHGVPVITTDIGGQCFLIEDGITGILVKPRDTKNILDAILKMKSDSGFYESLSFNCTEKAKDFITIEDFEKSFLDVFN
jgi:glycosyltransferase involved in cell wall biosynthesis